MRKDEIISVRSTLGKTKKRQTRKPRTKNEFTIDDDSASRKLKTVLVILPIVMIALVVLALVIGFKQFSSLFAATEQPSVISTAENEIDEGKLLTIVSPDTPLSSGFKLDLVAYEKINVDDMMIPDLTALMSAAKKAGMALGTEEGYVSPEQQHEMYMDEVRRLVAQSGYSQSRAAEEAEKTVPDGNHSENQTGLCVRFSSLRNVDFKGSEEYFWLMSNCIKYGFIQRYPEGKENSTGFEEDPALFRYVGAGNASRIRSMDMCLDEYVYYLNSR